MKYPKLCIFKRGGVRKGQSILVHAGTGGVGQAAINVALHIGLEIFTTVGTKEKREFIKTEFPLIKGILYIILHLNLYLLNN